MKERMIALEYFLSYLEIYLKIKKNLSLDSDCHKYKVQPFALKSIAMFSKTPNDKHQKQNQVLGVFKNTQERMIALEYFLSYLEIYLKIKKNLSLDSDCHKYKVQPFALKSIAMFSKTPTV